MLYETVEYHFVTFKDLTYAIGIVLWSGAQLTLEI